MSDRALRSDYEALQVREVRAREALAASAPAVRDEALRLTREVEDLEKALEDREARATRRLDRRPVSQRVAAFGFHVLFVAPIVMMVGVALGRHARYQPAAAWALLLGGVVVTLAWVVSPLRTVALRQVSPSWRLVRRARRAVDAALTSMG